MSYKTHQKVPKTEINLLWHVHYYDGPLAGMLQFREEYCWFKVIDETEEPRKFIIVRLTPEQLLEEQYWHDLFRANVGWNTDYDRSSPEYYEGLRPRERWDNFYGPYKNRKPLDISSNEILGWFED